MKILQVIPVFSAQFGGPVSVVRSISKELAKRHDVTVYTTSALDKRSDIGESAFEVESDGYRVVHFSRSFLFRGFNTSVAMARALHKTLREYDVVHLHSWRHFQDVAVHHYAQKYSVPYVLQTHGSLPRIIAKQRLKWFYDVLFGYGLLRDASKVIALTRVEAEQIREVDVPEEKIAIIPNGIDLSEYANLPPRGVFRKKFGIDEDGKIVLYLGRIHRIKGLDILAKAFSKVVKKLGSVKLVAAGPDDGYLDELESLIRVLKIEDDVLIPGPLYGQDKFEAYVDADLFALPSRYEMWGMTALEAFACGTPVIVTENCGIAEYLTDKAGLVVKAEPYRMAEALLEVLLEQRKQNPFRVSFDSLKEDLSLSKIVSRLEGVYDKTAAKRHGPSGGYLQAC